MASYRVFVSNSENVVNAGNIAAEFIFYNIFNMLAHIFQKLRFSQIGSVFAEKLGALTPHFFVVLNDVADVVNGASAIPGQYP